MVATVEGGGHAVVFRYGVVVFIGVSCTARSAFVEGLLPALREPYQEPEDEAATMRVDADAAEEGIGEDGEIVVKEITVERMQAIADVLAKSVVLAQYEAELSEVFNAVEPLAGDLTRGRAGRRAKNLLQHIGGTLLIQHKMVGRVQVSEKPELLWERPDLELFYLRLADEYELVARHTALERKLDLVNATATTALELLQGRRSLRVEWYIVILIVVEIVLTLYEMFGRG